MPTAFRASLVDTPRPEAICNQSAVPSNEHEPPLTYASPIHIAKSSMQDIEEEEEKSMPPPVQASVIPQKPPARVSLVDRANRFSHLPQPPRVLPIVARRMLLLEDGSAFGQWNDGMSLLIHPACATITMLCPDGSTCRQLSEYIGSGTKDRFVALLAFRNVHSPQQSLVLDETCWPGDTFTFNSSISHARWGVHSDVSPLADVRGQAASQPDGDPVRVLSPARLMPDGSIRIESIEGHTSLTLLPNARWVRLCYPVPLKRTENGVSSEGEMSFEYTHAQFAQLLPCQAVPPTWRFPLLCVMHAYTQYLVHTEAQSNASFGPEIKLRPGPSDLDLLATELPQRRSLQPAGNTRLDPVTGHTDTGHVDISWPDNANNSIQLLHSYSDSLPQNALVSFYWTPEAIYSWCNDSKEVTVLISEDQSCLVLKPDGFFYHYLEPITHLTILEAQAANGVHLGLDAVDMARFVQAGRGRVREKMYAASSIPLVHNPTGLTPAELRYELAPIAERAKKLQSHALGLAEVRALEAIKGEREQRDHLQSVAQSIQPGMPAPLLNGPSCSPAAGLSNAIRERAMVRHVGEFTSFKDGRIKVRFIDRCMLKCNASRTEVEVILPNGLDLHLTLPLRDVDEHQHYAKYVQPTLEFAQWTFLTPQQRVEQQRSIALKREAIQLQVDLTRVAMNKQRIAMGERPLPLQDVTNRQMQLPAIEPVDAKPLSFTLSSSRSSARVELSAAAQRLLQLSTTARQPTLPHAGVCFTSEPGEPNHTPTHGALPYSPNNASGGALTPSFRVFQHNASVASNVSQGSVALRIPASMPTSPRELPRLDDAATPIPPAVFLSPIAAISPASYNDLSTVSSLAMAIPANPSISSSFIHSPRTPFDTSYATTPGNGGLDTDVHMAIRELRRKNEELREKFQQVRLDHEALIA